MEVSKARTEKQGLEITLSDLVADFEKRTETVVTEIRIYRLPMYTGFAENLGTITIQVKAEI